MTFFQAMMAIYALELMRQPGKLKNMNFYLGFLPLDWNHRTAGEGGANFHFSLPLFLCSPTLRH